MSAPQTQRPYVALYIDVPAIAALASRCKRSMPALPGLDDEEVRRFVAMARCIDPRLMLLDDEFALNFRFDLFARMVAPLVELAECYSMTIDPVRGRDDRLPVYIDVLTLTVRTLCCGLELFAAVRGSTAAGSGTVRQTIVQAATIFQRELSELLAQISQILNQRGLLCDEDAVALAVAVDCAVAQLPPASIHQAPAHVAPPRQGCN